MTETADAVRKHYEKDDAGESIRAHVAQALTAFDGRPNATQLAALDQFHVRGLPATIELAAMAHLGPEMQVLDAGSGLGGPSRYLAETYGCQVTGVDLTPAFVEAAQMISDRAGLGDRVRYQVANLLALPFPDASFDMVWTQHVVMNIADRTSLYRELRRVLKPGGQFAFYDVLAGPDTSSMLFPLPWARSAATSFLIDDEATRELYRESGFAVRQWSDETAKVGAWAKQLAASGTDPRVATLPGSDPAAFRQAVANFTQNLLAGRLVVAMGICEAV